MASVSIENLAPFLWTVSGGETFEPRPLLIMNGEPFLSAFKQSLASSLSSLSLAVPGHGALVTEHADKPGEIERVASILAGWGVNVAGAAVRRNRAGGRALLITLVDDMIPEGAMKTLQELKLRPERWNCQELEDLDLTGFPLGSKKEGAAMVTTAPDQPGEIAKAARVLANCGLNSTGFLVFRAEHESARGRDTLQVNLLDKDPRPEIEAWQRAALENFCKTPGFDQCIVPLADLSPRKRVQG